MWTPTQRARYHRDGVRYPSHLTDAEWAEIEPLIPPAKPGGRPRTTDMRNLVQAIFYFLETGCQWRHLPKEFPPRSTVHEYLQRWTDDGTIERMHDHLYRKVRAAADRAASPTAAVIDAQAVKSAEKGGARPCTPVMIRERK